MPKKANKPDLEASASTTDDANDDKQESVLLAIQSVKQVLLAKMDEKATAQSVELRTQIGQFQTELRGAVDKITNE